MVVDLEKEGVRHSKRAWIPNKVQERLRDVEVWGSCNQTRVPRHKDSEWDL